MDSWQYVSKLPKPVTDEKEQIERLSYFLNYLQHPQLTVSNDAYAEFAAAKYEVIKPLRDRMPREKLRQWVTDPETPVTRIGLYGLLLGLCGTGRRRGGHAGENSSSRIRTFALASKASCRATCHHHW